MAEALVSHGVGARRTQLRLTADGDSGTLDIVRGGLEDDSIDAERRSYRLRHHPGQWRVEGCRALVVGCASGRGNPPHCR
ncbi:hypothetical protein FGE12_10975 [Aggregicoccus sp. 17bor-14]|uniref:hypothetical protein n=1 Tax=Myxococcaceae TaxID=31 RepID=UPI00129C2A2B|nr:MULTISPECIES: hypothetical protein [Myxococcaceae]MBF5042911.1 hypothetical protein [Simulacricoccus sp. 17bor-14]MRI88678.1 hypothetical protein [Aggregicoccus sp. 17bor-14]